MFIVTTTAEGFRAAGELIWKGQGLARGEARKERLQGVTGKI